MNHDTRAWIAMGVLLVVVPALVWTLQIVSDNVQNYITRRRQR